MLQLESEFLGQIGPPQARCQPWSPCWNFAGIPLMPFKPHFPKFPHLEFMCLVHEPENTYFYYENELILCCSMSFTGLVMAALVPWLYVLKKKEVTASRSFFSFPSFLSHHLWLYVTWEMMGLQLVEKGFIPWWTRVHFLIWLDKLWLDGRELQLFHFY